MSGSSDTDTTITETLTTAEKIAKIEAAQWPIAWDGCHKIYFLPDEGRRDQAEDTGYDIYPASKLRQCISDSCGLVFVSKWGYSNPDFDHEWNIDQGTEDIYTAAEASI